MRKQYSSIDEYINDFPIEIQKGVRMIAIDDDRSGFRLKRIKNSICVRIGSCSNYGIFT